MRRCAIYIPSYREIVDRTSKIVSNIKTSLFGTIVAWISLVLFNTMLPTSPIFAADPFLLETDTTYPAYHGHRHGTNANKLSAKYIFSSNGSALSFTVIGYDIDLDDEISVLVNGQFIGYMKISENNRYSKSEFSIPESLQSSNGNELVFRQNYSGYKWGVGKIHISTLNRHEFVEISRDQPITEHYGYNHHKKTLHEVTFSFPGNSRDVVLSARGFDIDTDTEIAILINGTAFRSMPAGLNNKYTSRFEYLIPRSLLTADTNDITFRQNHPGQRWGVFSVLIRDSEQHCRKQKTTFHLASNSNSFLGAEELEIIRDCAAFVTLNLKLYDEYSNTSLADVRDAIKAVAPNTPLLLYFRPTVWKSGAVRADKNMLMGVTERTDWILYSNPYSKGTVYYPDLTNPEPIEWLSSTIANNMNERGFDGVFLDVAVRSPKYACDIGNPGLCQQYQEGFDTLLQKIKLKTNETIGEAIVVINGVYGDQSIPHSDSYESVQHVDGAMFEYYGHVPKNSQSNFETDIEFYHEFADHHPNRFFLSYGRIDENASAETEHEWARYLYATSLVSGSDNIYFKYNASFQIPSHNNKSDGLWLLPELKLDIGLPSSPVSSSGCLYSRQFQNYSVHYCRHDSDTNGTILYNNGTCAASISPGKGVFIPNHIASCDAY